jgi:hypothetical protein
MELPPGISLPVALAVMARDSALMRYEWRKPAVES